MGTFHHDKHPLHGITVVVETRGPELYVGRCDDIDEAVVTLRDAESHREGEGTEPRAAFLARAARVGVWPKLRAVRLPRGEVTSIRRLGESAAS